MSRRDRHEPHVPVPPQPPSPLPDEPLVLGEGGGVRTLFCHAPTMRQLMETLTTMLSEHVTDDDEAHVSYSAMQVGSQEQVLPRASVGQRRVPGLSSSSSTRRW